MQYDAIWLIYCALHHVAQAKIAIAFSFAKVATISNQFQQIVLFQLCNTRM